MVSVAICSEGGNIELLLIVGITLVVAGRSGCCHGWNAIIVTNQLKISFLLSLLARFYLMLAAFVILDNENSVTDWVVNLPMLSKHFSQPLHKEALGWLVSTNCMI